MKKMKVDLHGLENIRDPYRSQFMELLKVVEAVLNSKEFERKVKGYTWATKGRIFSGYLDTEDSPEEVYDAIMTGQDQFHTGQDYDLDLFLTFYYSVTNVIGYTYPNTFKTWMNEKYFYRRLRTTEGRAAIVGNIIHEYLHNMGYTHPYDPNPTWHHTVPYAVGYIAEAVAIKFLEAQDGGSAGPIETPMPPTPGPTPEPIKYKWVCKRLWYTFWIKKRCRKVLDV
jgi:hypothetical protein